MRIFLAGIMQGSHVNDVLHDQNYRRHIKQYLARYVPQAEVYDPLADHQQSLSYDNARARQVFLEHIRMCAAGDVVLAFLPAASMGTAIEMWEAKRAGYAVVSITPMARNWVVRFLSDEVYPDVEAFERAVASGDFARLLEQITGAFPIQRRHLD